MNVYIITVRGQRGLNDMQRPEPSPWDRQDYRAVLTEKVMDSNVIGVFSGRRLAEHFLRQVNPGLMRQMPRIEALPIDALVCVTCHST